MKKRILAILLVITLIVTLAACAAKEQAEEPEPEPEPVEEPVEEPADDAERWAEFQDKLIDLIRKYPVEIDPDNPWSSCRLIITCEDFGVLKDTKAVETLLGPDGICVLQFEDPETAEKAAELLKKLTSVLSVEPDNPVTVDSMSSPCVSWGSPATRCDAFVEALSKRSPRPVIVAVIDSGVSQHKIFDGRLLRGYDFVDDDDDCTDLHSHGTHVAGTVADATRGLNIKILPIRVLDADGRGWDTTISVGIRYAADNGADIINMSLGGGHSGIKESAISYAEEKGVVVVVSAGNEKSDAGNYCPAHIPNCITVSAVDRDFKFASSFSNYGDSVDFAAPGVNVRSSVPGAYGFKSGTSMAAPHIAAMAAMLRAAGLAKDAEETVKVLASCSLDLGNSGRDKYYGYGVPQLDLLIPLL